jgi:ParB family chromosome partitioning protein
MIKLEGRSLSLVSPTELQVNPWNPNSVGPENMAKLTESIKSNGLFKPVLVRTLEDGSLQIIGGQHRSEIAESLGIDVPIINLGEIDEMSAKKLSLIDNDGYGENDSLKVSKILNELVEGGQDILSEMTYSNQELSSLLNMTIDFDLDELDDLDETLNTSPEPEPVDVDSERAIDNYKILKFKVAVEDIETVEDALRAVIEELGLTDSDASLNRGEALTHVLASMK